MGMKTAVILRSTLTLIRGTTRRAHLQVPAMANDQIIVINFVSVVFCFRFCFCFLFSSIKDPFIFVFQQTELPLS